MPLETFSYLSSLVAANPASTDGLVNGDDHIRGIKLALLQTFPGLAQALTAPSGGSYVILGPDGAPVTPGYAFATEPTLGFYRSGPGKMASTGRVSGDGLLPAGTILDFAGPVPPAGYLVCDGSSYLPTDYPDLFAAIGYTWGQTGSRFLVPHGDDRFRRGFGGLAGPVGTYQDPNLPAHTHSFGGTTSTESNGHTHSGGGTTGDETVPHKHAHSLLNFAVQNTQNGGSYQSISVLNGGTVGLGFTDNSTTQHQHAFTFTTGGASATHTHTVSGNTGSTGAGVDLRPVSYTVLPIIKT